ncbi:hypothetical protein GIB67_037446 [Kingdonia uniflora]|uniref:alpha-L-fucosidase n=1 Tax=Kingdonia uniflora TaxID=39325 RepID=A0A7J7NIL6_9MAGN|nr:hypothetical protein GIB67_037446 [Kingdonia uniflora]
MEMNNSNSHHSTIQTRKLKDPIVTNINLIIPFFLISLSLTSSSLAFPKPPPLPILPLPSSSQLSWQLGDMALFLHFGTNTFTDSEWGTGHTNPSIFNPKDLDTKQWVRVAKDAGFSRVILTVKHHDGFCLWPSEYTDYSVGSSSWRNGSGDVVGELANAAREAGIGLGVYLSPWDRHEGCYGRTVEYNGYFLGQMTELLTRYGEIKEVWLDGAKGEGEKDMEYYFDCWFSLIHQLQPNAVIFSDGGPDTRWVGDEAGVAGSTCWSLFNGSSAMIGNTDYEYSRGGDSHGQDWIPAECDVSIRPGWFWHASEVPKSAITLLDIYYKSVGRNCLLLLNVPPNSSGLISMEDVEVLQEFTIIRQIIFSNNVASNAVLAASSTRGDSRNTPFDVSNILKDGIYTYWAPEENQNDWTIYLDFEESIMFNVLQIQEPIQMGQRVSAFHLDVLTNKGDWKIVVNSTTVGYRRILRFSTVESQNLRFVVDKSRADPLISYLGFHFDPFSPASSESLFSDSQVILPVSNHSRIVSI